ncbi:MAG: carboxypeptidase-like regulatory domain-containing protein [Sphingobacteriales bacterium]|nr:MAG: carboxypeptidase-like regulatory domain-containing protein [Sphingobacteriales bacterium]
MTLKLFKSIEECKYIGDWRNVSYFCLLFLNIENGSAVVRIIFVLKTLVILLSSLLCLCNIAQAQDTSIGPVKQLPRNKYIVRGTVYDKQTGDRVPYATIIFPHSVYGTLSDDQGAYVLGYDEIVNDTLKAYAIGYKELNIILLHRDTQQVINITLKPDAHLLKEVIVRAGEDPALRLMRKVIANKKYNTPERFTNYQYENYSKIELDLLHISKEEFERLPIPYIKHFGYIYNNLDTTTGPEPFLPFFLIETLSDYYYQRAPSNTREYIKANQVTGINNKSIIKYMGKMYLTINAYDDYWTIFDTKFVAPASSSGPAFYKYRIKDTTQVDGKRVINISYKPLRSGENCLSGEVHIVDTAYALQKIDATIPKDANINWVKGLSFSQQFNLLGDSTWFCTKENMTAELAAGKLIPQFPAVIVRRSLSYDKVQINKTSITDTFKRADNEVIVSDSAQRDDEAYWSTVRHDDLSHNEAAVYKMFDTVQNDPTFLRFKHMLVFLATGVKNVGPLELGPYWSLYSRNRIEGDRFRFSMGTTPKLFKNIYLNGYLAYGTRDERFKYNIGAFWILKRKPRMYVFASRTHDIDRSITYYDNVGFDNLLSVSVRRKGIPRKFVFSDESRFEFYNEYFSGFSHLLTLIHRVYDPYDPLPSLNIFRNEKGEASNAVTTTDIGLKLRYAFKERFLEGNYYRVSLGSKYPIAELRLNAGVKGLLNSSYEYKKVAFNISDNVKIAPLGELYLNAFAGKIFGTLPYPLLEIHPGNETYVYNKYAFSLMTQYEFISDKYAGINIEHSLGGGFLKYIPLVKKLKFRQFWTAKGMIGSLSDANQKLNLDKGYTFRTLNGQPYLEVGTGLENILHIFRVDFVWRLTPKRMPSEDKAKYFAIMGSINLDF